MTHNGEDALTLIERNASKGEHWNSKDIKTKCKNHQTYKLIILDKNLPRLSPSNIAARIFKLSKLGRLRPKPIIVLLSEDDFPAPENELSTTIFD